MGTEPPRPGTGAGCFGKSCLVFLALFVFLGIAFIGGGFWALRHIQKTYSATEPLSFGNVTSLEPELAVAEDAGPIAVDTPELEPVRRPTVAPRESIRELQARWREFERAAEQREKARVELTANDINRLIENDPKLRGKAAVSIQDNVARLRVSVPLDEVFMMNGRYLNAEATIEPSADGNPENARFSNIILGNQAVPESVLDQRMFGMNSIRGYMTEWLHDNEVSYFGIRNNRVIGETSGGR